MLSLVLHLAFFLALLPRILKLPSEDEGEGAKRGTLAVRLAPKPAPPPVAVAPPSVPVPRAPEPPVRRAAPSSAAPSAPSAPRVIASRRPSPVTIAPTPVDPPPAAPAKPPATGDLASYIEARRRARDPSASPATAESEQERTNREAAARLGLDRPQGTGADAYRGGGIFQIHRIGYADAEFIFFGWNRMMNRNTRQMVEVQRGSEPGIEIAVVRRMIAIIRDHERGSFTWESRRLGRDVTLSARAADTAELEAFLMREFFPRP